MEREKQIQLIRELAKKYAELMHTEENREHYERSKAVNDLKPQRPPVLINEIPWHEINIDHKMDLICEDEQLRKMEWYFREKLFRWEYFRADMYLTPYYPIGKAWYSSGNGTEIKETVKKTDEKNGIVSHCYSDELDTEEKLERMHLPVISIYPEQDAENKAAAQEVLGEILPVRLGGSYIYYSPWDQISMLRGVENIYIDLLDRPEFIHKTMEKFTQIGLSELEQREKLGLLDTEIESLHCTPPYTDDLPFAGTEERTAAANEIWFRAMAQTFASVSPQAFEEFEFDYMKRLAEKCGLVYYGCCEPLDRFVSILKRLPNLRKLGVSPWANERAMAEQIGGDYVYARKPNPANVGLGFDEETIRKEIRNTVEICLEHKCPYEIVLKDISTVNYKPQNLVRWNQIVQETLDEYYK